MKGTFRFIYSSLNGKGSRTQVVGSEDETNLDATLQKCLELRLTENQQKDIFF